MPPVVSRSIRSTAAVVIKMLEKLDRLERPELAVDRAVSPGDSLATDAVTRDDPLPLEHELGQRPTLPGAVEEPCRKRPTSGSAR